MEISDISMRGNWGLKLENSGYINIIAIKFIAIILPLIITINKTVQETKKWERKKNIKCGILKTIVDNGSLLWLELIMKNIKSIN